MPDAAATAAVLAPGQWRVDLLGGPRARCGDVVIDRFPSRAVVSLLARLALFPRRSHAREELIELLWPGVGLDAGRNRLRQALSTLRRLLEPPGSDIAVLVADRQTVRLRAGAVGCDAVDFESAVRAHRSAEAAAWYAGELLPGFNDAWIAEERTRLAALKDRIEPQAPANAADHRVDLAPPVGGVHAAAAAAASSASAVANAPAAAAAAAAAAATAAADARPLVRLPAYLGSFVGRDAEVRRCGDALAAHRLVTIVGPGGSGKTRLAVEAGRRVAAFDPVVFVGLADCTDGDALLDRTRAAVRLPPSARPLEALAACFGERRLLLVLDNFEQLVATGGPEALLELLAALPGLHVLATSRRALRLAGERELALRPFAPLAPGSGLAEAARDPAVSLFVERARSVRDSFRLTAANSDDLIAICGLLDGLPLALEIAASRVRSYALPAMRAALAERYAGVTAGGAGRHGRHASLAAAFDWSWQLLDERARAFLASLAVFRGGCTADEARAVCGYDDAAELLDQLVADSLLTAPARSDDDAGPGGADAAAWRFSMLASTREFVRDRGDIDRAALRRRHRRHYLQRALADAAAHRSTADATLHNLVEALRTALDDGDHEDAVALALAPKAEWESVGTPPDALALMERLAAAAAPATPGLSLLLAMLARLLLLAGRSESALARAEQALALAGDDPYTRAEALFAHTRVAWVWKRDGPAVIEPARDALRWAERAGSRQLQASTLSLVGAVTLWGLGRPAEADGIYRRAEALYLALGNPRGALQAAHGRLGCLHAERRHADVVRDAAALERRAAALGNVEAQLVILDVLQHSLGASRRWADALAVARRETALAEAHHKTYNLLHGLWPQARWLARLRQPEAATRVLADAQRRWTEHFGPLAAGERRDVERVRRLVVRQIGPRRWAALWAGGAALPETAGVELAGVPAATQR